MKEMELLAPGGDVDAAKAAIVAGANAIYCGLDKYNARNRAENIRFDDLPGLIHLAHQHDCQIFLTLNILILDAEIPELIGLLNKLVNTKVDGVIVQDLGMMYLLKKHFPSLDVHASTQLTTHNRGQIEFLQRLGVSRVNLSRELNLSEISDLSTFGLKHNVLTEVFVHGSYCISFSGLCYMSSEQNGKSGNRGRCSQPCREKYEATSMQKEFPLNLKDNSAYFDAKELYEAGVATLKLEGRIKEFYYVSTVVNAWRKQLNRFYKKQAPINDKSELYKVFNRDFSNGYLMDNLTKDMFIDNPGTHSSVHYIKQNNRLTNVEINEGLKNLYAEKDVERDEIKSKIDRFSTGKIPMKLVVSGEEGYPLCIHVSTENFSFSVTSEVNLAGSGKEALKREMILKRMKAVEDTEYELVGIDMEGFKGDLYISFKVLTALKLQMLSRLKGKEFTRPVSLPKLNRHRNTDQSSRLCILISSETDFHLSKNTSLDIYFQLPNDLHGKLDECVAVFQDHSNLLPWFPSILIGDDYTAAVSFLDRIKPKRIVSNNSGVGFAASEKGIAWVAGPQLNSVNSYSLGCLKEYFNCDGAFVSNEISKGQIQQIKKPDDFKLYYSIYHPISLMTSRQCLMHTVSGCEKQEMDEHCIGECERVSSIKNLKGERYLVCKEKGNYHELYNEFAYMNTSVVQDFPDLFSHYLIDLREIKSESKIHVDKARLIAEFKNHIALHEDAGEKLFSLISPTTFKQYKKGLS